MQFLMDMAYTLSGHTREITDAVWSPDGEKLLSVSKDKALIVWKYQPEPGEPEMFFNSSSSFETGFNNR
jgi:WD40 repeat protein